MLFRATSVFKAIVLRTTKYGEADLIVTVLTEEGLKKSLIARSALKSKKRFGGGLLEPTHVLKLSVREQTETRSLASIEEASMIEPFEGLRSDYDKLQTAFWVLDVMLRSAQEDGVQEKDQFFLLGHGLRALSRAQNLQLFRLHFGLRFLYLHGVLEIESWMQVFLKTPLSETLDSSVTLQSGSTAWVENRLESFLKSGSVQE